MICALLYFLSAFCGLIINTERNKIHDMNNANNIGVLDQRECSI